MTVHRRFPSNICGGTWIWPFIDASHPIWWSLKGPARKNAKNPGIQELPKSRCTKLVETYPRWLNAVIAAKGASTKYRTKGLNAYVHKCVISLFEFKKISKDIFSLMSLWVIECRWIGKNGQHFTHLKLNQKHNKLSKKSRGHAVDQHFLRECNATSGEQRSHD